MKAVILGCGTSTGVPRVGNDWGACDPADPRNRRSRASVAIETEQTRILVDTGPDLREQLLRTNISHVDAVVWTHDHADHCHGIDDLRQLFHARGAPVESYARPWTLAALGVRFAYAFEGRDPYPPVTEAHPLEDRMRIGDIDVRVTDQPHGAITSVGLRFEHAGKSIGYATDFNGMTSDMAILYEGLDLWIVDSVRRAPHPTHPHLAQVLDWVERFRPRRTLLTHMDHSMDYATLAAELPDGVTPAYDGLEVAA